MTDFILFISGEARFALRQSYPEGKIFKLWREKGEMPSD